MRGIRFIRAPSAGTVDWWLSGGISASDVAGVWQSKAVASLAASYLRLAGDQGYASIDPAIVGGVAPTWDAVNGWTFAGAQYLKTGMIPTSTWSVIVKFSSAVANTYLLGESGIAGAQFIILPNLSAQNKVFYYSGGLLGVAPALASGTLGMNGRHGYRNGVPDAGDIPAWTTTTTVSIYIGAFNNNPLPFGYFNGKIQSIAIYKTTITDVQFLAVSTAMP